MKKTIDKLKDIGKKVALGLSASLVLAGCENKNDYFNMEGEFRGYSIRAQLDAFGRNVALTDTTIHGLNYLSAHDRGPDGRFDAINIELPKGHALEKYANPESLEVAYNDIVEQYLRELREGDK